MAAPMNGNGFTAPQPPQVLIAEGATVQVVQVNPDVTAVGFVFLVQGHQVVLCCSPEAPWELFAADLVRAADKARPSAIAPEPEPEEVAAPVYCWSCSKRIHGPLIETGGCLVCGPSAEYNPA